MAMMARSRVCRSRQNTCSCAVAHVVTTIEDSERFGRVLEQIGAH
jgi:hypothetical protein